MKPTVGISVDGSAKGNPGFAKYRGVDIATNKVLFLVELGVSTNNIAEYIAICHAVLLAIKETPTTIYTDSQTALSWLRSGYPNTTLADCDRTHKSLDLLKRANNKMRELTVKKDGIDILFNETVRVSKWYTSEYGESPADFGEK